MRFLDELEREIERIAYAEQAPKRRLWRLSGPVLVLLSLSVATVAVAATTGILFGEPVKNPEGAKPNPEQGVGVNVSGKLFDLRVPDPDGGPEWGVRMTTTSRGLGCVQLGRVVDGKLGVLGQDGAFDNDGKFHERGTDVVDSMGCQQPDAAGNVFVAMSNVGLPASGDGAGCAARGAGYGRPACDKRSLRDIFHGLLGPEAVAITYTDEAGRTVRQPVAGPEGAYLIVRRTDPERRNVGYFSPGLSPTSGVESIEYRDGTTCIPAKAKRVAGVRACPPKGYVKASVEPATAAELRSPVTVEVGDKGERPDMAPKSAPEDQRRITISFRARRAADAKAFYTIAMEFVKSGKRCQGVMFGPVSRDIAAGTTVTETLWVPLRCRGSLKIRVGYEQPEQPTLMPFMPSQRNAKVGRATVKLSGGA